MAEGDAELSGWAEKSPGSVVSAMMSEEYLLLYIGRTKKQLNGMNLNCSSSKMLVGACREHK